MASPIMGAKSFFLRLSLSSSSSSSLNLFLRLAFVIAATTIICIFCVSAMDETEPMEQEGPTTRGGTEVKINLKRILLSVYPKAKRARCGPITASPSLPSISHPMETDEADEAETMEFQRLACIEGNVCVPRQRVEKRRSPCEGPLIGYMIKPDDYYGLRRYAGVRLVEKEIDDFHLNSFFREELKREIDADPELRTRIKGTTVFDAIGSKPIYSITHEMDKLKGHMWRRRKDKMTTFADLIDLEFAKAAAAEYTNNALWKDLITEAQLETIGRNAAYIVFAENQRMQNDITAFRNKLLPEEYANGIARTILLRTHEHYQVAAVHQYVRDIHRYINNT